MTLQLLVGQKLLTVQVSWSHSDTLQSVGLLGSSDQPDAENSTWQHTTHKRQPFEPTIPASERPQTYALDRAATGTGATKA
jgi:hypothetical protein